VRPLLRRTTLAAVVAGVLCLAPAAAAAASATSGVLVAAEPGYSTARVVAAGGGRLVSAALGLWRVDRDAARRVVPALERRGLLRYSAPDRVRESAALDGAAPDPLAQSAWQLERVGATSVEPPGPGVPVNVVDSLVDRTYPDLADRPNVTILSDHTSCKGSDTAHATAVAAIAAAPANGVGTVGVYPTAALWSTNACNLADSDIIAAIDEAIARGQSVITLSLGGPGFSRPLYEAVLRAVDKGSLVVSAAGNYLRAGDPVIYPAAYPHVLTVGSTNEDDAPSSFSGSRSRTDIVAPGERMPLLDPEKPDTTTTVTGTSYSTPIVAAAAAWLWTARSGLDAGQVSELLRRTARDVGPKGFDARTGFGLLDIPAALRGSVPPRDPQEPNDDVDLVKGGAVFPVSKPGIALGETIAARVDAREDPTDVYRLAVPAGKRVTIRAVGSASLGVSLWRPRTRSILESGAAARRDRIGSTLARAGQRAELSYTNTGSREAVIYVAVRPAKSPRASYELSVGR
jgi:hypothetical protein